MEDWVTIRNLNIKGQSIRAIASLMGISRNTVRGALRRNQPTEYKRKEVIKTKSGTWSNIYFCAQNKSRCDKKTLVLNPKSNTLTNVCEADLGCNFQRRYRFKLKCDDNGKISYATVYSPSSTDYHDKGSRDD